MKLHALGASAVAIALACSSPVKADETKEMIGLLTITAVVGTSCPGYEVIEGGATKFGDRMGVDVDALAPAFQASLAAISDQEFDRKNLVPEVTRVVRGFFLELFDDMKTLGKKDFCKRYGPAVVNAGFMAKK